MGFPARCMECAALGLSISCRSDWTWRPGPGPRPWLLVSKSKGAPASLLADVSRKKNRQDRAMAKDLPAYGRPSACFGQSLWQVAGIPPLHEVIRRHSKAKIDDSLWTAFAAAEIVRRPPARWRQPEGKANFQARLDSALLLVALRSADVETGRRRLACWARAHGLAIFPRVLVRAQRVINELVRILQATCWVLVMAWLIGWSTGRRFSASLQCVF